MHIRAFVVVVISFAWAMMPTVAGYTNYESSHVHPIALTPDGARLVAVNTPDAVLEVFAVGPQGDLTYERSIPVGLEPVSRGGPLRERGLGGQPDVGRRQRRGPVPPASPREACGWATNRPTWRSPPVRPLSRSLANMS